MNIKSLLKIFSAVIAIFLFQDEIHAQISTYESPISFNETVKGDIPTFNIASPKMADIIKEDSIAESQYKPYRFAKIIDCNINFIRKASITKVNGGSIFRLAIESSNAKALSLYYNKFTIPDGGKLFIYNQSRDFVRGAYTSNNNPSNGLYANELIRGKKIILEYFQPKSVITLPQIVISGVGYAYRSVNFLDKGFGGAGDCEININCSEGNHWQNQKRGVVRISIRNGGSAFWCSGSVLNNALQNYDPYMLTADHCAGDATANDLEQWMFYFNYESEDCDNPILEPISKTLVGATKIANGGHEGTTGSDFYLMLLSRTIPTDYETYYNGWSRTETAAQSGVSIHHPQGDIKKISTYDNKLVTSQYNGNGVNSHWKVFWSETDNGRGVTEGGSSGSPIFNNNGLIVGTLTGGWSSCNTPTQPDYYGKISWSWDKNGSTPTEGLKNWLDPNNSGITSLEGLGGTPNFIKADFINDTLTIKDGYIDFSDMSAGSITTRKWIFEGGTPETSGEKNPSVLYNRYGKYDVTLIIEGSAGNDTLVKKDEITVIANVYPIPTRDFVTVNFGSSSSQKVHYILFNVFKQIIDENTVTLSSNENLVLNIKKHPSGIYFLSIDANNEEHVYKIIINAE
ncbi:MAG: T9SS type A sorting domain-containing protein [Bacteroidota bacterium]|nr:T9SS type A sorting domain-containing protein [Bacteroidota bacterium]